uniref:Pectinesterase inhibitor domain-containing protein n=1 Tax=Oryza brachyantha TaxID=4533 RepID=J3L0U8_ORYBR
MAKSMALILVVIAVAVMLVPAVESTDKLDPYAVGGFILGRHIAENPQASIVSMLKSAAKCRVNIDRCISETNDYIRKALDGVVAAALPAKKKETEEATLVQTNIAADHLVSAKATGDVDKVATVSITYRMAADAVLEASPDEKFLAMKVTFKLAADPIA